MLATLVRELRQYLATHPREAWYAQVIACLFLSTEPEFFPALGACLEEVLSLYPIESAARAIMVGILNAIGGSTVACINKHTSKVPGAGLCCAQVNSGALRTTATTLPPYAAGELATNPTLFPHVMVTTASGKCGTCLIVGSKNAKHPGKPVLKFVPGGPGCPTTTTGCCALATQ